MERVLSVLMGVHDYAVEMATADQIPADHHAGIAEKVLNAFLDGMRDGKTTQQLATVTGTAYFQAVKGLV